MAEEKGPWLQSPETKKRENGTAQQVLPRGQMLMHRRIIHRCSALGVATLWHSGLADADGCPSLAETQSKHVKATQHVHKLQYVKQTVHWLPSVTCATAANLDLQFSENAQLSACPAA